MKDATKTTIDAAGRLIIPKPVREQSGIAVGDTLTVTYRDGRIEIEPATRAVRVVEKLGFRVAESIGSDEPLSEEVVRRTREGL